MAVVEGLGIKGIERWVSQKPCSLRPEGRLMVAVSERREGHVGKSLGVLAEWTGPEKMGEWSEKKGMVCGKLRSPAMFAD